MRRLGLAVLLLFGCRRGKDASPAIVVTPRAVDGGALVTVEGESSGDGRPDGCPSRESLALEALRFEAALRERFGFGWDANVEENGTITAAPNAVVEEDRETSARIIDAIKASFPSLLLGPMSVGGHRGIDLHCWPELVKPGLVARVRHAACFETHGIVVDLVRIDRSRNLPAFAPLLRSSEEEARDVASAHARGPLRRRNVRVVSSQLVAECDPNRRASSLVWIIDSDGDDYDGAPVVDAISVDAKTRAVVDAKTVVLGD